MKTWLTKRRRRLLGFSLTEVMAVSAIVTSIPTGAYVRAQQKAYQTKCVHNLQQIGQMIQMYYYSMGHYPKAAFYPDNPFESQDSLIRVMEQAGQRVPREMWVCPAAPEQLQKRGLTFIFNDNFAGRKSLPNPSKAWLMIEVNCVSKKVPPPHPGGYNILFADGHVITTKSLPRSITSKQRAALNHLFEDSGSGQRLASAAH